MDRYSAVLPEGGTTPRALDFPWFPVPFQAVIWRNWHLIPAERIARVLHATTAQLRDSARLLGLAPQRGNLELFRRRAYVTIIRNNWHLLTPEQLCQLLDWEPEKLGQVLRDDDFLWQKLGRLKPVLPEPITWRQLTEREVAATKKLAALVRKEVQRLPDGGEKPFAFLNVRRSPRGKMPPRDKIRMCYHFSALYGDLLMEDTGKIFTDAILSRYAASGINALWIQAILYQLVPWLGEEIAGNWRQRIAELNRLNERAARFGIRIVLYFNEPRGISRQLLAKIHPEWLGTVQSDGTAGFCTRAPGMMKAFTEAVRQLALAVPKLGGIFAITCGENMTTCASSCASRQALGLNFCPVCGKIDSPAEEYAAVLNAIADGLKQGGSTARLFAFTWAWEVEVAKEIIDRLRPEIGLLSVSEWKVPTHFCHLDGYVWDYTISKLGPGEYSRSIWEYAAAKGHPLMAKIQMNNSWECPILPFIPVPQLVSEHLQKLRAIGVDEFMVSWTLGGYPGGNFPLLDESCDHFLHHLFGKAASRVGAALNRMSEAFRELPVYQTPFLHRGPQGMGPANLWFATPSGYHATMVGYPYDDMKSWSGYYDMPAFADAFRTMSLHMKQVLNALFKALPDTRNGREWAILAEAFYLIFRSTSLQMDYIALRGQTGKKAERLKLLREERRLCRQLLILQRQDARIGFEPTNHYMFLENDLLEKLLNLDFIEKTEKSDDRLLTNQNF